MIVIQVVVKYYYSVDNFTKIKEQRVLFIAVY